MPNNPTTALVKTATSPALARVSSQLALTDKLLAKPEEPFLIPYRREKSWYFCDKAGNIVIDRVYEYPKFLDQYNPVDWYVWVDPNAKYACEIDPMVCSQSPPQQCDFLWSNYVAVNIQEKAITLASASDVIIGEGKLDGRKTVIIGRTPYVKELPTWWMRNPTHVTTNVGDTISVEDDFFGYDYMINMILPRD